MWLSIDTLTSTNLKSMGFHKLDTVSLLLVFETILHLKESGLKFQLQQLRQNIKLVLMLLRIPPIPEDAPNNEMTRHTAKVKEMLSYIPPGENAWYIGIPEHLQLNVKGARLSSIYKRLDPDKPAYTVTGSGGGGTHMYHWEELRALTNRERARLQTFPDDFVFCGNKEAVRKQVGMAVPPEGAKIVFEAILKSFAGLEYDNIQPSPQLQLANLRGKKQITIEEVNEKEIVLS